MLTDRRPTDNHVKENLQFPYVNFDGHNISLHTQGLVRVTTSTLWRLQSTQTLTESLNPIKCLGTTSTLRRLRNASSREFPKCGHCAQLTEFAPLSSRLIEFHYSVVCSGVVEVTLSVLPTRVVNRVWVKVTLSFLLSRVVDRVISMPTISIKA